MKTSMIVALGSLAISIVGLPLLIVGPVAKAPAAGARPQQQQKRERAMDRIVHVEQGIIRDIPQVPRLCDGMAIRKGKIDIGGCDLYYEQEGEGIPLLLINGGPGNTHHGFHPYFSLAKDFARIIYYDQRGCGLSDYKPDKGYTVNQAVDDMDRLRQALGVDKWVVLGFSYGGLLAQCYATRYTERLRGLVLTGSSMGFFDPSVPSRQHQFISEQEWEKMRQIEKTPGLSEVQRVFNRHLNGDWKRQSYYRPSREDIARGVLYDWMCDKNFGRGGPSENEVDLKGAFKGCPIPTLILEGKWDMTWGGDKPHRFHRNHPNATLVLFDKSAHNIFKDEPHAFFARLRRFLTELPDVSEKDLASWKEYLVACEREKEQAQIPEGPMTEQERVAIEKFNQMRARIDTGHEHNDASTPLNSLLSFISACANRDIAVVKHVRVPQSPSEYQNFNFDSWKTTFSSLEVFRAPPPPEDAKEGDIWVIYTKVPGAQFLNEAHIFVLWRDNWMHSGTVGNPTYALQWRSFEGMIKRGLKERLSLLPDD